MIVPVLDIPDGEIVPTDNLLDIFRLVVQMEQICTEQSGIGLSAVQVGVPLNLFIVQRDDAYEYYLNCEYEGIGEKHPSVEGCLSLRDKEGKLRRFEVQRFASVKLKGQQLKVSAGNGNCGNLTDALKIENIERVENGLYAVVMQHEIDHQLGILISDFGKEVEIY